MKKVILGLVAALLLFAGVAQAYSTVSVSFSASPFFNNSDGIHVGETATLAYAITSQTNSGGLYQVVLEYLPDCDAPVELATSYITSVNGGQTLNLPSVNFTVPVIHNICENSIDVRWQVEVRRYVSNSSYVVDTVYDSPSKYLEMN